MPTPFDPFLAVRPVVVLDGGLATLLESRGADLADPLWSAKVLIDQPQLIRAVHAEYFEAGADIATTATYQATFPGFAHRGFDGRSATLLFERAVTLAIEARDAFWSVSAHRAGRVRPLVAASVGPYGAMLADGSEYRGGYEVTDRELENFHRPRLEVLAGSGADLIACETVPSLREALVLARLLGRFPDTAAWISFSCRDERRTSEGQEVADCAAALSSFPHIAALGINCTSPKHMGPLLSSMRSATPKLLIAYPNSGERYDAVGKHWHGSANPFADLASEWRAAGARIIGGCCRTTPADIARIRALSDR
jgi:homocysteine S-methyltransferase